MRRVAVNVRALPLKPPSSTYEEDLAVLTHW